MLNLFTEFYIKEPKLDNLNPSDPNWIGAWWLGFLLIFVLSFSIASLISLFPAKVNTKSCQESSENAKEKSKSKSEEEDDVLSPTNKLELGSLKDLPKTLYSLITNFTFMGITMGATCDGFLLAGEF